LNDPRAWATIGLAPWDGFGAITDGTQHIEVPTLILTGRLDETTPMLQVRGLWAPLTVEPRYFGIFERGGHYSFSPAACLLETGDGCGDDNIPLDDFTPMVNQATLAFLESVRVDPARIDLLPEASDELTWE
jgi:pimeloyl-ACP methyl ester carboxylesterase